MNTCKIIQIQTPGKMILNGLWLGNEKAETVFVYVHGLGGTIFAQQDLLEKIAQRKNTAVLTFNNRGSGVVTQIKHLNAKTKKGYESLIGGQAHEVFTECVDDIEGAVNYAKECGAKNIFLIGHSTGCQKSVYYLSKKPASPVKGVILLAPLSDYASAKIEVGDDVLKKSVMIAKQLVENKTPHELMPADICPFPCDAQRFLSLNIPESLEEIFSYAVPEKKPAALQKVKVPILVVVGTEDEYLERTAENLMIWFKNTLKKQKASFEIVENATHNFKGFAEQLNRMIRNWEDTLSKR